MQLGQKSIAKHTDTPVHIRATLSLIRTRTDNLSIESVIHCYLAHV